MLAIHILLLRHTYTLYKFITSGNVRTWVLTMIWPANDYVCVCDNCCENTLCLLELNWDMAEMKGGSYCTCVSAAQSQW